mgnify:CR=1 FL=1
MITRTLKNGNTIEISNVGNTNISYWVENAGDYEEKNIFNLSGRIKFKSGSKIGTMKITAAKDKYFTSRPSAIASINNIGNKNRLRFKPTTLERDSNDNVIACSYDLIYIAKERSGDLNYNLINNTRDITIDTTGIRGITFGAEKLKHGKQTRKIDIYGTPGHSFNLAITKLTDYKDTDLRVVNSTEKSILTGYTNSTTTLGNGKTFKILNAELDSSGRYSFKQNVDTARFPIDNWEASTGDWDGWYSRILTHFVNPKLTLRTETSSWSTVTVDSNGDGSYVTFNSSNPIATEFSGIANRSSSAIKSKTILKQLTITHVFKTASGEFAIRSGSDGSGGTLGAPKFSTVTGQESDWTNTVPFDDPDNGVKGNGGTRLNISNITAVKSTTSSSFDTLTLTYIVDVVRWGSKDVTMTMNVDNIANIV